MMEIHQHAKPNPIGIVSGWPPPFQSNVDASFSTMAINTPKSATKLSAQNRLRVTVSLVPYLYVIVKAYMALNGIHSHAEVLARHHCKRHATIIRLFTRQR